MCKYQQQTIEASFSHYNTRIHFSNVLLSILDPFGHQESSTVRTARRAMQFIIQFPSIIRHGLLPPSDHSQSVLRSSSLTTGEVNDRRTYRGCDIMDANEHFPSSTVSQPFRAKPAGKFKQTWSASSTIRRIKLKPQTAVSGVPSSENCQSRSNLQHH